MKRILLLLISTSFIVECFSQVVGDYQSNAATMNWNATASWQRWNGTSWVSNPSQGYPGQNAGTGLVTIRNGHTVTLNLDIVTNPVGSLTVGEGTSGQLTLGNGGTNDDLTVAGNITVNAGATVTCGDDGDVFVGGSIVNNSVFDLNVGGNDYNITFNGAANQTLSGTGTTTDFNTITINNSGSANNNIVEVMPSNFTAVAGFLTLTQGIIKMSGSYTFSNVFFGSASYTINSDEGIWLNNSNVTVTSQAGDATLYGLIRISAGTYNVGNGADWWLGYYTGSVLTVEGGALNISGAFCGWTTTETIAYSQSGGTVTVNTAGNSLSVASFEIWATGSVFNMSGGTIVLQRVAGAFTDFINFSTTATVTGGTLQVGNASTPASSLFWINSTPSLYNLTVNSTNSPVGELRVNTTVINDITINNGSTLDVSPQNVNINIGHNWTNNGTFTQGTASVTFNGSSAQLITGTTTTTFNNLTINNTSGGVSLSRSANVSAVLTLTNGILTTTSSEILTMNAGSSATFTDGSTTSFVNGPMVKVGNTGFTFPVGKSAGTTGMRAIGISSLSGSLTFTAEFMRAVPANRSSLASGLYKVSACEYWTLNRTEASGSAVVTLSWNANSPCNLALYVTQVSDLRVARFDGSLWQDHGNNLPTGDPVAGTITSGTISSFSPFALGGANSLTNPLYVKFSFVKAYASGAANSIEWSNLTETDVRNYEVEKSVNGTVFFSIKSVTARSNNNSREDYTETDIVPEEITYYRIKAINAGGSINYSSMVKVVRNGMAEHLVLYPNPLQTDKQLTVQFNSSSKDLFTLSVYNTAGALIKQEIWQHPGGSLSRVLSLPQSLNAGQYFIKVTGNEKTLTSKFVIQ